MQRPPNVSKRGVIELLVKTAVQTYAQGFQARHESEYDNPKGMLNMKIHNVFITQKETGVHCLIEMSEGQT